MIIFLILTLSVSQAIGEVEQNAGCGFGFELLMAKLEAIEDRLIALETRLENASPNTIQTENLQSVQKSERIVEERSNIVPVPEPNSNQPIQQPTEAKVEPARSKYPLGIEPTAEQLALGEDSIYSSCREVPSRVSGIFLIKISDDARPMNLLCDAHANDVGWIVVQNRFNGSESFYRKWSDYEAGFGSLDGEFWLGLERISQLVNNGRRWEIMFLLTNWGGLIQYSRFTKFQFGNADDGYMLKQATSYSGNAGDSISRHAGMKFTTYDRDNDAAPYNCAKKHRGGWWYHQQCVTSNLNGVYGNTFSDQSNSWMTMKPNGWGLKASKIMIREML
uniref:Fibrinogen C-terminal domain-containing protein n=1 Tax=Anopheles quadriannulatus TaxID=34691 RepID=A0A182X259_ANOQN